MNDLMFSTNHRIEQFYAARDMTGLSRFMTEVALPLWDFSLLRADAETVYYVESKDLCATSGITEPTYIVPGFADPKEMVAIGLTRYMSPKVTFTGAAIRGDESEPEDPIGIPRSLADMFMRDLFWPCLHKLRDELGFYGDEPRYRLIQLQAPTLWFDRLEGDILQGFCYMECGYHVDTTPTPHESKDA